MADEIQKKIKDSGDAEINVDVPDVTGTLNVNVTANVNKKSAEKSKPGEKKSDGEKQQKKGKGSLLFVAWLYPIYFVAFAQLVSHWVRAVPAGIFLHTAQILAGAAGAPAVPGTAGTGTAGGCINDERSWNWTLAGTTNCEASGVQGLQEKFMFF